MIKQQILFEYLTDKKHLLKESNVQADSYFLVDRVFTGEAGKIGYRQECRAVAGNDEIRVFAPFVLPSGENKPDEFFIYKQDINYPALESPHLPMLEIKLPYKKIREWYLNWQRPGLEAVKLSSRFIWEGFKNKEY